MINDNLMQMDLSVLGMYQHADIVVKVVMMGLLLGSVGTWAVFLGKYAELTAAKRCLKRAQRALQNIGCLNDAAQAAKQFPEASHVAGLIAEALDERALSGASDDTTGLKERTGFRLERRVASIGRHAARGNGLLATVGSVAPFIGLFGTVWGIMNSFIGIAKTQTTNLAVVAPGIAEALLATAVGLIAAIPAVVIYNLFVRMIAGYQASLGDTAAQILFLQSRDADTGQQAAKSVVSAAQHIRVG